MAEQVRGMLDPDAVKLFVRHMEKMSNPNVDRDLG